MSTCIADDCNRTAVGRGMCGKHWQRWDRLGALSLPTTLDRLSRYFDGSAEGCWLWTGAMDGKGYGAVYYEGRVQRAHRAVYMETVGPIAPGLHLDHLCRTPQCVRPSHLEPVTPAVNRARGTDINWQKRARTHCPQGHPYEGRNLVVRTNGSRSCRACGNEAARRYQAKKKVS